MIKKVLMWFFVTLGVIFFGIICYGIYLWNLHPNTLESLFTKPVYKHSEVSTSNDRAGGDVTSSPNPTNVADSTDKHPNLTPSQEDALELIGVDPSVLPSEITPEQEACFITKLGAERVMAIKAGATPDVLEIFKAKECMAL